MDDRAFDYLLQVGPSKREQGFGIRFWGLGFRDQGLGESGSRVIYSKGIIFKIRFLYQNLMGSSLNKT